MTNEFLVKVLLLTQVASMASCEEFAKLRVDNNIHQIVDSNNRIRIFHGINLVCKHHPWYYEQLLDEKYAKHLGEWGLNVVRLGTMWSGLEPEEGKYSSDYVAKLKTIVTNFEKHGIWVILDMHQDVASKEFGTYDGFPDWLNQKLSENVGRKFPWPLEKVENWFCGYLTYEACNTYQQLYDNYYNGADKMAQVWKFIATEFKDHKNILGYDLINEPWPGNIYKDGSLLSPAVAASRNLVPLYEKIVSKIREVDQETLIFWETVPYSHWAPNLEIPFLNQGISSQLRAPAGLELFLSMTSSACGGLKVRLNEDDRQFCRSLKEKETPRNDNNDIVNCIEQDITPIESNELFGTGFERVPGGDQGKSVLSWHYYFPMFVYQNQDYGTMMKMFARTIFAPQVFNRVKHEIKGGLGGAHFLTEFGLCTPDTESPDSFGSRECNFVMEMADSYKLSWTYWDTATVAILWDNQGNSIIKNVKGLSRPYPLKVSGRDISYKYNPDKKTFQFKFKPIDDSGETDIYLPVLNLGESPQFSVSHGLPGTLFTDSYGRLILRIKNIPGVRDEVKVKVVESGSEVPGNDRNLNLMGQIQNVISTVFQTVGSFFGRRR